MQRPPPSPPNEDHPNGNGNRTDDNVQGGSQRDALVPFSNSSSGMYTLGNIQKLDTEEPILELSLGGGEKNGHGGKKLVFQGKKVKTCGRYLVLSCKTSGAVHCRNVFEELVVFGGEHEVVEESGEQVVDVNNKTEEKEQSQEEEEEEQDQLDDDSVRIVEEEEEKDSANLSKNVDTKEPLFYHYGGSERAVDGGRPVRGIKRKKSLPTVVSMDIGSKRANATSSTTRTGKTIRKSGVSQLEDATNVIDLESEEKEEEEDNDDFEMNSPVPTTARTRYVRKSATKRVKYTFDEEEEQDQGQNSEESEEEECSVAFDSPQQSRKKPPKIDSTCTPKPTQKEKKEQHGDVTVKKDQTTRGTTKKQSDVTRTTRNIILPKNTKAETELNALSTSSPAFRKRRKSPKKTSSASKSLDSIMMNDDEDLIFVE